MTSNRYLLYFDIDMSSRDDDYSTLNIAEDLSGFSNDFLIKEALNNYGWFLKNQ